MVFKITTSLAHEAKLLLRVNSEMALGRAATQYSFLSLQGANNWALISSGLASTATLPAAGNAMACSIPACCKFSSIYEANSRHKMWLN